MRWADYIGLPWAAGAQGPGAYDCMGFFKFLQQRHFGIEVPAIIAPDYDDPTRLSALFGAHSERLNWQRIAHPEHGCAVIAHRPMHVGTWLASDGGGVLHCVRGPGVIFTSDSAWPVSGFGRREFFRHTP
jgi:hypothetical protein